MLDFNINVDLQISQKEYPICFEKRNICVHCGKEGTLKFVDKFGNETRKEIHPLDHIKCNACGRHYSILWKKDQNSGRMYPTAVDPSIKQEFVNMFINKTVKSTDRGFYE